MSTQIYFFTISQKNIRSYFRSIYDLKLILFKEIFTKPINMFSLQDIIFSIVCCSILAPNHRHFTKDYQKFRLKFKSF